MCPSDRKFEEKRGTTSDTENILYLSDLTNRQFKVNML